MSDPVYNLALFSLSLFFGITMLFEGFLIVKLQKQIIPLPTRLLYWVSVGLIGKAKSTQRFAQNNTIENQHTYAKFALFFGASLVISSFIYLNWILLN